MIIYVFKSQRHHVLIKRSINKTEGVLLQSIE